MKRMKTWDYSGTLTPEISKREILHRVISRRAAAEGMVLLKNNGVLPLHKGSRLAVYGGGAAYTIKGGTGSGAVNNRDSVSILDGLRNAGFTITSEDWMSDYEERYQTAKEEWIRHIYEISEPGDFMSLYTAHASNPMSMPQGMEITAGEADTALYVISRVSGEGADRHPVKGDYYLNEIEEAELSAISKYYQNLIVILNVGGIIDTSFADTLNVSALVLMSQAGMEGGNALADLLTGDVCPSGKLTDTWAVNYNDYPCSDTFSHMNGNIYEEKYSEGIYMGYRYFDSFDVKPKYPFGFGLSYTSFTVIPESVLLSTGTLHLSVKVINTGSCAGKEVVFFFASCPDGMLEKEQKRLIGFEKTPLLNAGENCTLNTMIDLHLLESYHPGHSAYYMEQGSYYISTGQSAASVIPMAVLELKETRNMQQLKPVCPLLDALKEIHPARSDRETYLADCVSQYRDVPVLELDGALTERPPKQSVEDELQGKIREIRSSLTLEQKATMCCGKQNNNGEFIGNASGQVPGAAGETATILMDKYQVSNIVMADGPAGIRIQQCYRVNPEDGSVYRMRPYEALENRIFGKDFEFEGAIRYYQFCTAIPVGTLLAQSFDLALLKEVGTMIGREMEEFGLTLWLAPGMNLHRNPLCGRNFEYYSEDPLVSGRMAGAITAGVQSLPGIGTTIKHFACNNQEDNRRGVNSIVSERALRELYLKGYEIAIRETQPMAVMTSYNKVNGVHAANNKDLCTELARNEWGFQGIIMTDWTTTNADGGSSAAKCISAGNDLIMPGNFRDIQEIIDAVNRTGHQQLDESDLDQCCDRILRMIFRSNRYTEE